MPQNVTLKASGLFTFQNLLGSIPDGALTQADNTVIDRDGVVEPRRGFNFYGSSFGSGGNTAKQLLTYKGRVLRHWLTNLDYDSDGAGTFTNLSTTITEPVVGTRIKYLEANGNFYFTTNKGIMKISSDTAADVVSNPITPAGGIKAIDGDATLNSQEGFFTQDSSVAYRIVWGITDTNNNVILGSPSPMIVVTNEMVNLIVTDFNNLMADLATVAAADPTQAFQDTSFAQLKISGSSATVLYNSLTAIASGSNNQLDTDLSLTGIEVSTTANSPVAYVPSSQNIQTGMLVSGNSNLATTTNIQIGTTGSSTAAYVNSLVGLTAGMLTSNNPNIPSNTTISSIAPGAVISTIPGNGFKTSGTADYVDFASTSTTYRLWFSIGSVSPPSGVGVTLEQVTVLTTDADTDVANSIYGVVSGIGGFTCVVNNNIVTITGNGINTPTSVVADTTFTISATNILLSNAATGTGFGSTTVASSTIPLTTTSGSTTATTTTTLGLSAGTLLSGNSNLPSGTTVASVASDGITLTLSQAATGAGTVATGINNITVIATGTDTTVNLTTNSTVVATVPSFTGLSVGQVLSGNSDLVSNTTITAVNNIIVFTVSSANATIGATYTNNSHTFTVLHTIASGTTLVCSYSGAPLSSGTLTKSSGTGDSTITFSTAAFPANAIAINPAATGSGTNSTTVGGSITLSSPAYATGLAATNFLSTTFQNIPVPSAPNTPATTTDLTNIQNYYDAIVNALNYVAGISATGRAAIGGSFSNSTQSATVNLTWTVPQGVTTAYFYQVYRSPLAISTGQTTISEVSPSDEEQLVYENNPTSDEISAKTITYHDIVPETFREGGANLYTNANSGSGILQANEIPPLAQDMCLYRGCTFYANTTSKHSLDINLLTAIGVAGGTLTITEGSTVNTYVFATNTAQVVSITTIAGSLFTSTGTADYVDLYSATNATTYRVWFSIGSAVAPSGVGVTLIPCVVTSGMSADQVAAVLQNSINTSVDFFASTVGDVITVTNQSQGYATAPGNHVVNGGFSTVVTTTGAGENPSTLTVGVSTASTPGQQVDETARSLCRVINKNSSEVVYAFYLSTTTTVPGQIELQNRNLGDPAFSVTSSIGTAFNPTIPSSGTSLISDDEVVINRIYYSTLQQPEAVPIVNYQNVGPQDKAILRILPLRDSVFILSQDGVYQLTGTDPTTFQIVLFDGTTKITSADSAVVLNNQIYAMTTQGVVTISSTGISIISRPIENLILPLEQYNSFTSATFGVNYDTDRAYLLGTVTNPTDTIATQLFRYNIITNTWTRWPVTKTCGVVPPETNILYFGAGDTDYVEQERKTFTRIDHADRSYTLDVTGVSGANVVVVSQGNASVGDVLVQTQYLTVAQFNRLLNLLDSDPGVEQKDYDSLQIGAGADLQTALIALANKIDVDQGINDSGYYAAISGFSGSFPDCQSAYNVITARLNTSSQGLYKNYPTSSGTIDWEVTITAVGTALTMSYDAPMVQGDVVLYNHIQSQTTWAPHAFGDPSMLKHVNESTLLFQNVAFSNAVAAYASDLSTGYDSIPLSGEGIGLWGSFDWGTDVYGGSGTSRPFRTLVPVNKQKSRYINCQFTHASAREEYAVFGLSYTFNPISNKAYR